MITTTLNTPTPAQEMRAAIEATGRTIAGLDDDMPREAGVLEELQEAIAEQQWTRC